MKHTVQLLFLSIVVLLTAACQPRYAFEVDSIASGEMNTGESFVIISANPEIRESDLRFREAANYIQLALEGLGLFQAPSSATADMIIELDFFLGEPRDSLTVRPHPETYWVPGRRYSVEVPVRNKEGQIIGYSRKVYHEPSQQYTQWEDRIESTTLFEKSLTLTAYDNRLGSSVKDPVQLWSVTVVNTDGSNDLRHYLPFMAAAALPYIGFDTGRKTVVVVSEEDLQAAFGSSSVR